MILRTFPSGPLSTNAYVVSCPRTGHAAIIDPAPDSFEKIAAYIENKNLTPKALLLTHSYWDHIADAAAVKEKYNIPIYIHSLDAPNLESPGEDGVPCWLTIPGATPSHFIDESSTIDIGDLHFEVIHTPGHTPGCVCFYCPGENILISGDTLFKGTIGILSLPTSRPALMWPSLAKLSHLPPETRVYPGHGPSTTIGHEKWLANAEDYFKDK